MLIYKVLRAARMGRASRPTGETAGAPVDLADGFVHFSTAAQLAGDRSRGTSPARPGSGSSPCDADAAGAALRWEPSRGGALFPHLYRPLDARRRRSGRGRCRRPGRPLAPGRARMSLGERLALPLAARGSIPRPRTGSRSPRCAPGSGRARGPVTSPRLAHAGSPGSSSPNPLGLAAGLRQERGGGRRRCSRAGFGFVEVGAATPLPQPGNPRPRLFRLARGPGGDQPLRLQQRRRRRRSPRGSRRGRRAASSG